MSDPTYVCPDCGSENVTVTAEQMFMANTGEHYCHSVKTHDYGAKAQCLDCNWEDIRGKLVRRLTTSRQKVGMDRQYPAPIKVHVFQTVDDIANGVPPILVVDAVPYTHTGSLTIKVDGEMYPVFMAGYDYTASPLSPCIHLDRPLFPTSPGPHKDCRIVKEPT